MIESNQSQFDRKIAEMRTKFIDSMYGRVLDLEAIAESMRHAGGSEQPLRAIAAILHKVAGVAPTLGFDEVGKGARQIEGAIVRGLDGGAKPDHVWKHVAPVLERQMDAMEALLDGEEPAQLAAGA